MRLDGKTAVITGGAGVIGLATARRFLDEGAQVLIVDNDSGKLDRAMAELASARVAAVTADVTDAAAVARYADEAVARFGAIDIFFNNAAILGPVGRIEAFPDDAFEQVMRVNVFGVFLGMKHVTPKMRDGGSVIITSSVAGVRGAPFFVAYNASKHAVVGIMRTAASELAPRRIRVNTIHPAGVDGDMVRDLEQGVARATNQAVDATRDYLTSRVPFGRYVQPDEIAQTVTFLASDESRMISGTVVSIDGGSVMY